MKKAMMAAAETKRTMKENESESSTLNKVKDVSKSKMVSGSKDMCVDSTGKKNKENGKTKNKDVAFIVLQKNEISERIEEIVCELEGHRWDAILMSETWRSEKSENMGDTSQTHVHGSRKTR